MLRAVSTPNTSDRLPTHLNFSSDDSLVPSQFSATARASQNSAERLQTLFLHNTNQQYTEDEISQISSLLQVLRQPSWARIPRIYTVLRLIGQLKLIDSFLTQGYTDAFLPFSALNIPFILEPSERARFLEFQTVILTTGFNLETGGGNHFHFHRDETLPFRVIGPLGRGSYGYVDKVQSLTSQKVFARKLFRRRRGINGIEASSFQIELQILKRIKHHHCVELVGSYTDQNFFSILISPVANCNLKEHCEEAVQSPVARSLIRGFFGCLLDGLNYLHNSKVRHRDIKPENILIKNGAVLFTDFGISLDWEGLAHSTTTAESGRTPAYCAPEVAEYSKPRNSASDIWSLGCVFLEMITVLKGSDIQEMRYAFIAATGTFTFHLNRSTIDKWTVFLRTLGHPSDDVLLDWTLEMLTFDPNSRPKAFAILQEIEMHRAKTGTAFCRSCCFKIDVSAGGKDVENDELWAPKTDSTTPATLSNLTITTMRDDSLDHGFSPSFRVVQKPGPRPCVPTSIQTPASNPRLSRWRSTLSRTPPLFSPNISLSSTLKLVTSTIIGDQSQNAVEANLIEAARLANISKISKLTEFDVKDSPYRKSTLAEALCTACEYGNLEVVSLLLEKNPNTTLHFPPSKLLQKDKRYRGTALHYAVKGQYIGIVSLLFDNGASPEVQDSSGASPLFEASRLDDSEILECFLNKGANLEQRNNGMTMLMDAAYLGNITIVKFLVQSGAFLGAKTKGWDTALDLAIKEGNLDCVIFLIQVKASITDHTLDLLSSQDCSTELWQAILSSNIGLTSSQDRRTALLVHFLDTKQSSLAILLIQHGVNPNFKERTGYGFGYNYFRLLRTEYAPKYLLVYAIKLNEPKVVRKLLELGADITNGDFSRKFGHRLICAILDGGYVCDMTAMHMALFHLSAEMVEILKPYYKGRVECLEIRRFLKNIESLCGTDHRMRKLHQKRKKLFPETCNMLENARICSCFEPRNEST